MSVRGATMPITWSPALAAALVTPGFRALAKRPHPDGGGPQEAMVALTAPAAGLRGGIGAGWPTMMVAPAKPAAPPLAAYDEGWLYCDDVIVRAATARALRCRF